MKEAAAASRADLGIFKRLKAEHEELWSMMRVVGDSDDQEVRSELFPKIKKALLTHARGEEQEVYPVLERHSETRDLAERAQEGLFEMEELLQRLSAAEYDAPEWPELFAKLLACVQEHVDEEEHDLIPRAKLILDDENAREMESRYVAVERQVGDTISGD